MKKFISIRKKLITNTMLLITVTFAALLSVLTVTNIITVNKNIEKTKNNIRNTLIAKGKTLAQNNSKAMSSLAEDNAFTAIRELVSSTVWEDPDLVYGIYMDNMRIPWVYAYHDTSNGIPKAQKKLDDSMSLWASSLDKLTLKEIYTKSAYVDIIEFAAPVAVGDEIMGFIRYGFSTGAMKKSISEAQTSGRATRNQAVVIIFLMGVISVVVGFIGLRKVASDITSPIAALVNSSKMITEGNYDTPIRIESNDEIGDLATHFELMRSTIKKYTSHLQELIDEKMHQVNDILNNIDHGLFTINLDGSVNQEYSARTNIIMQVDDVGSCSVRELFRLDHLQEKSFYSWLELVKKKHGTMRWSKLARLAPVQEIELHTLSADGETINKSISIAYQQIYNKVGVLCKIMVLVLDISDKKHKELQMVEERQRHENEVKAILSIANTPADEITNYLEDTSTRLRELLVEITTHLDGVKLQREMFPSTSAHIISKENIDRLYRDIHTIKGNSGSYGFETLARYAHLAETELEKLVEPVDERRNVILANIDELLRKMDDALHDIKHKASVILGSDDEMTIRIPEARIKKIVEMSQNILLPASPLSGDVIMLLNECMMLSWKPLKTCFRKYHKLAYKIARKLHKNISFIVMDEARLFPEESIHDLDEILIHLIRNAVDHGIEVNEIRDELGKGIGHISVALHLTEDSRILSVSDDGSGIDFEAIVLKSIEKNYLTKEEAGNLSDDDKVNLLFKGGITTTEMVSEISGRGRGMQIIYNEITNKLKGSLKIDTTPAKGTTFIVTIPGKGV